MKLSVKTGRIIMGRLEKGEDLLSGLEKICADERLMLGEVRAVGAVNGARIGYYDQDKREYRYLELNEHLEIVSLIGNLSIKDGGPFIHAHVSLGNEEGEAFGGHLTQGTEVFACEYSVIEYLSDVPLVRGYDEETGLFLWK